MDRPPYEHLETRVEQGVLVLTVTAPRLRSDAFELVEALRQELLAAVAEAKLPRVALDLARVEYFGSAGFRPLLSLRRQVQERNGHLVLCNLHPDVEEVLLVTRLINLRDPAAATFEVARDVPAAVARLNQAGA